MAYPTPHLDVCILHDVIVTNQGLPLALNLKTLAYDRTVVFKQHRQSAFVPGNSICH